MTALRWCVDTDATPYQVINNLGEMAPQQVGGWLGVEMVTSDYRAARRYQQVLRDAGYQAEISRTR